MMWAYESVAHREARRRALEADRDRRKPIAEVIARDAIVSQDAMIMNRAPVSPSFTMERAQDRARSALSSGAILYRARHYRGART
jgi:hypothetical protein